jgi:putative spermidine/putrescine transport system ATP-binding protein
MIFVTHDQGEAMLMSDRIAILRAGQIVAVDSPHRLYDQPETAFVAGFLGEANILPVRTLEHRVVVGIDGVALPSVAAEVTAIALRPEHARFNDLPETCLTFSGRVCETLFLGDRVKYQILTLGGDRLVAYAGAGLNGPQLRIDDQVKLGWLPSDIRYLREEII